MKNKQQTYIIAEAGVNHNGSITLAERLIDAASEAGADAVKFQTFKAEKIASKNSPKAEYQMKTTNTTESQFDMLKKLELSIEDHFRLVKYANQKGIQFLSSPFDLDSIHFLDHELNLPLIKIPSGEITNAPFLLKAARTTKPIILSTGMSTIGEIEDALSVLAFGYLELDESPSYEAFRKAYSLEDGQRLLKEKVTVLHCTTQYPTPVTDVNLLVMDTITSAFQLPVGLSDHTLGITIPIAAVARGARVIEKHFTLDRSMDGPDHKASLEPSELKEMVQAIRNVEIALGTAIKTPAPSEIGNKRVVRKSIHTTRKINKGEVIKENDITIKRPGYGLSPFYYWDLIGSSAKKDYDEDEVIT